jgi:hypothetical protein
MYEQIRDSKRSPHGLKKKGWNYKVLLEPDKPEDGGYGVA